ncbi:hypothetical protein J2Z35_001471 [Acetoanaerobium pronyense]|uniref:PilZ domain-containing protein n=1 Tax=Acetoanaerobium pronyense TaxID=1482736 RepID=A0ABS4KIQ4_9FIRM|nr:PilZ domain-containing protein [Acetoanaerobium pronyense]MBP2027674.1 hypothetical protein [Acetoanaerobium pronyense]
MQERRKAPRIPYNAKFNVDSLFRENHDILNDIETEIEAFDISRRGLGFKSFVDLPLDFYFDVNLYLSESIHFFTVLKIIRKRQAENCFEYGCEFVGLAENLAMKIKE